MNGKDSRIHIIRTGGTIDFIDPAYDELNSKIMKIERNVEDYLRHVARPEVEFSVTDVCQKDSRELTDQDREALLAVIQNSEDDKIIVTHGTYTMNTTGIFLQQAVGLSEKTIILTGSMIPLWGFMTSDAGFNLGFTIASLKYLKPGVYISLNGKNFNPSEVHKNLTELKFEPNG